MRLVEMPVSLAVTRSVGVPSLGNPAVPQQRSRDFPGAVQAGPRVGVDEGREALKR